MGDVLRGCQSEFVVAKVSNGSASKRAGGMGGEGRKGMGEVDILYV